MIDFMVVSTRVKSRGGLEVYPKFIIKKSEDLMIRGGDFYAIWVEKRGLWSTDEQDAIRLIDEAVDEYVKEHKLEGQARVLHMWDAESGMIDSWHKYCQKQMRDSFNMLDEKLVFSNTNVNKKDYASKVLPYPLEKCNIDSYDRLMSVLYSEEERRKIEWAIGSIVSGESKHLQKFMVLYGAAGTGKSTILNIIQQLFEGYYTVFDAKALGSSNNAFALESFKTNPLVAIQHDGDLSHIEDNTRLNSLVSHELMTVNEKFRSAYANRFKAFLFMGTNKPVRITDAKSGLIRRLIDVSPTGEKLSSSEYSSIMNKIGFELGGIAWHCKEIYAEDPGLYDNYIPSAMLGATNDFYNYILDSYPIFKNEDGTTLKGAWALYNTYCEEAKVSYPYPQRIFKEELKNYFSDYKERYTLDDGTRVRSYYQGFKFDSFETPVTKETPKTKPSLCLTSHSSIFDAECADCLAQYASKQGSPMKKWEKVKTKLKDLDTTKLHYVRVPENHIVIDFDIPDANGEKSRELNLKAASKFPPTYTEFSKSGSGVHLHYIYDGDVSKLSRIYDDHIEIKVFNGNSSLRRKLSECNDLPIAVINSGLPLKGEKNMVNFDGVRTEKGLRTTIKKNLRKEIHANTKPSVDFIYKILEDAYSSGLKYDVSDMYNAVYTFAANSTNHSDECLKTVMKMHFKSEETSENKEFSDDEKPVFFDVEVFPNLFLVNWKVAGEGANVVRMINPSPAAIEDLLKMKLIGFNNRRYDNHILYARMMGYTNEQLYKLSQRIVKGERNAFFGEAYNLSYTDIYDYSSKKQSLKKWEIELGIHHQELGLPWDQPVPEELWTKVAEYCDNDVIATEAVFNATQADYAARLILAEVAGMTANDTTNSLTTRIIFGKNRQPQDSFNYRDMGDMSTEAETGSLICTQNGQMWVYDPDEWTRFDKEGRPLFPGYKFERGVSTYRDEEVGEGGYVYSEPGMYGNVALLDIASMHPSSIVAEQLFGKEFTARFQQILDARITVKHLAKKLENCPNGIKDIPAFDDDLIALEKALDGVLVKYVTDAKSAKALAQALKIAINSVYGLTAASFVNPFRDPRNIDNIVAKRGALFMINLKHEVQKRGYRVAHIKTDSIKIPDATPEIINFVTEYGKMYGYNFEHEATYDRMCLVNDAVYIAKYASEDGDGKWTATGTQFQVPYVFKKLFTHEPIIFDDMCETKSVSAGVINLDMNENLPDTTEYEKEKNKIIKESDLSNAKHERLRELDALIAQSHNYIFIGRVGLFCPIKPGANGGVLYREKDGKYYSITGTKGYRWLEAEQVKLLGKEADIDRQYYDDLCNAAIEDISKYGDFEWFTSDDPYVPEMAHDQPPWKSPCGVDHTCFECPQLHNDEFHCDCRLGFDISEIIRDAKLYPVENLRK